MGDTSGTLPNHRNNYAIQCVKYIKCYRIKWISTYATIFNQYAVDLKNPNRESFKCEGCSTESEAKKFLQEVLMKKILTKRH